MAHAPIGEYYSRFNIDESTDCRCGEFQTRDHLLHQCDLCILPITGRIQYLPGLAAFLEENPWALSFADRGAVEGLPVGGPGDADESGVG